MSTREISTETIGEKLRHIREKKELSLRKVAALLDIDVAILSKIERGERRITKEVVLKLANIYEYNVNTLLVSFLSDKILYEIQDEDLGIEALKVAEERVNYLKASKK
ncbi:helix-turn-helix domain-containing protein [Flavobacterium davisii]|uniref:helix-turn-helix domain-containing protein n=1 Tax=Flavobacterium davisii TaxID=2906077 RepID=UPI00157D4CC8|nr:helix-turn-helix transcriptional regulator [Flavobacterium davisii]